jgi:predicted dehydrogenase
MSTSGELVRLKPRYAGRPPVRIAVVGLGARGVGLAEAVTGCAGAELAALCDRSMAALTRVAPRFPGVPLVGDFSSILEDATIEAVVIATPAASHYRVAMASLAAGKHVLVDKPVAAAYREAQELKAFAERLDLLLMPGHVFLYSRPVAHVKALIDSGRLGDVHFISSSRVNLGQHQADSSVLWDSLRTTSRSS